MALSRSRLPLIFGFYSFVVLLLQQSQFSAAFAPWLSPTEIGRCQWKQEHCLASDLTNVLSASQTDFNDHNAKDDHGVTGDSANNNNNIKAAKKPDLGGYDAGESLRQQEKLNVGDPQIRVKEKERSVTSILKELAAIQQQGPQKYCILGTRHCSFLHQQIIELL